MSERKYFRVIVHDVQEMRPNIPMTPRLMDNIMQLAAYGYTAEGIVEILDSISEVLKVPEHKEEAKCL